MTVITTSTAATATAYSNQRKIDRCQNGVLWAMFWDGASNTTDSMHFRYSTDDGASWTDGGGFGFAGTGTTYAPNGSLFIDLDDYAHVAYKDRSDGFVYYRRGTPNAGRTAWTWSAATAVYSSNTAGDFPDIVAHREGTGWRVHILFSRHDVTTEDSVYYARLDIDSAGAVTVGSAAAKVSAASYGNTVAKYPSIDFNHTGDGKTVAGGTPHLYVAWSAGATGAGQGIRFKKATYSGGSWTWGTEREIDSTRFVNEDPKWVNCLFDGTRVIIPAFVFGSSTDLMLYERDAADTTTTTRTLASPIATSEGKFSGSATYDGAGNVYLLGRNNETAYSLSWHKWNRSTATLGAKTDIYTSGSASPWASAKRGYSGSKIEFIYTDGTASPYSVTYGAVSLALGATIGVTTEADTAQPVGRQKAKTGGPAAETDVALPLGRVKQVALGTAAETDAARPLVSTLVPVYYRFTPPTVVEKIRTDRLFSRYGVPVGQTVIKIDGVYTVTPYPWLGDLEGLKDGVDYFLGGRSYVVTNAVAAELTAAGYTVVADAGYGIDPYGSGGFGS